MTFKDWCVETKKRYETMPATAATKESAIKFWWGVNRRTIDRWIGKTWWERDWDILVVLDATRVDLAREVVDDDVESAWSAGSTSIDWIERHFADKHAKHWTNAGYVTGNPFADHDTPHARCANLKDKSIGHLDLVYERAFQETHGIKTTPPEEITDAAIHAWRNEDIDRLIVHYMQPHQPFRSRPDWESVYSNLENLAGEVNQGGPCIWKRCRDGEIPEDKLWEAYRDNLEWVLDEVENRLLTNVDGNVTITADHGNGMGEWNTWAHPPGSFSPAIRKVPVWYAEGADEGTIDPDITEERAIDNNIETQLEALGYR